MSEPIIAWEDVLPVGKGGPGCGLLTINGKQPPGAYRYLPPALFHGGMVYASTFVPNGFVVCAINPQTLARVEMSGRIAYVRLRAIEGDVLDYFDTHGGDTTNRVVLRARQGLFRRIAGKLRRGG
ncbi:MAG: hypothetical protein WC803_11270 [Sphingomonas sp.]